ncbi:MAG: hypothetical protein UT30_C0002G0053 [Candidatus Uhrbacteria bacterium GW2011_GWF2_39_13]|uniref:ATPase AAA-type core domain-containing protein n=1 Tax=Candidatus Uhrbacteria bacterium GW2011_GWF2_39_13 TaxID=1618995 RepID=A0A0G0MWW4_9BACT|nr:MAG: hypothetical protein UT30_C0002G0053 [Candidatus Uhrbacteria bacterium GW2011_GWF2_39_13]
MSIQNLEYPFRKEAADILNSGAAHALVLTGNVEDLFWLPSELSKTRCELGTYVPIIDYLRAHWGCSQSHILISYELHGPIRFVRESDLELMRQDWIKYRSGLDSNDFLIKRMTVVTDSEAKRLDAFKREFDDYLARCVEKPAMALKLMSEMCKVSRQAKAGDALFGKRLLILIERTDMIIPEAPITQLSEADRLRVTFCQDWFSDPDFLEADDSVVMVAETSGAINHRVIRLPQVLRVSVPSPDEKARAHYITWFNRNQSEGKKIKLWDTQQMLASLTAGLSIHALRQMLVAHVYDGETLGSSNVLKRVEQYIEGQLGEGVVSFKKPEHSLKDVIGFSQLKFFLKEEVIPRLCSTGLDALPGAAIAGPIGGGKTFLFEAVAAELGMVVLELKNLRSKWFGETDVILERLYRVLMSLGKVMIFIDEADTVFGGLRSDAHETEKRLTGEIQKWMSDPKLRGRVVWLLMTARIQNLSPDIRRPGRVGNLIIPVLDPEDSDHDEFILWTIGVVGLTDEDNWESLKEAMNGFSAADFGALRSELKAKANGTGKMTVEHVLEVVEETLPADIGQARRYQRLQALVNCTRKSLLPGTLTKVQALEQKEVWLGEIREIELEDLV